MYGFNVRYENIESGEQYSQLLEIDDAVGGIKEIYIYVEAMVRAYTIVNCLGRQYSFTGIELLYC